MSFVELLKTKKIDGERDDYTYTPFASKIKDMWSEGYINVSFIDNNFGHLETAEEMKGATESEGLKLYFDWLKKEGILN